MDLKKLLVLSLSLSLLTACGGQAEPVPTGTPDTPAPSAEATAVPESSAVPVTETPAPTTAPETTADAEIRVSLPEGPIGLGAAKLMAGAEAGQTMHSYDFTVVSKPDEAAAALSSGEADIAALPTDLAAALYHRNEAIQLLALNTEGVLYILENGNTVHTLSDLAGQTVYASGQGESPEYILSYLLEQNGLVPGEDVKLQWMDDDELITSMASGELGLAMLPVPDASEVMLKNPDVRSAVNLEEEWDDLNGDSELLMGCVVVRTEFARENPRLVEDFLKEYGDSVDYMEEDDNLDDAAALAAACGLVSGADAARKVIPASNLSFETGDDMMSEIQGYYKVLFDQNPVSIGGSIPDGAFYYRSES